MKRMLFIGIATLAAVGAILWFSRQVGIDEPKGAAPGRPPLVAAPVAEPESASPPGIDAAKAEYEATKAELVAAIEAQKAENPDLLEPVEEDLGLIEGAVVDLLMAINGNPDNDSLRRMLVDMYRTELDLLQKALHLSGDQ